MLMSIIKLAAVSSFLTSKKYWNSRIFDYRTCQPVPYRRTTPFPVTDASKPTHDKTRYLFLPL